MIHFKRLTKRGLALFVALVMCMGMIQLPAFAVEGDPEITTEQTVNDAEPGSGSGDDSAVITDGSSNQDGDVSEGGNASEDRQSEDTNASKQEQQSNQDGDAQKDATPQEGGSTEGGGTEGGDSSEGGNTSEGEGGDSSEGGNTSGGEGEQPSDPVAVTGVTLDPTTAEIKVGETVTLTATVEPDNAADKTVTWTSSDTTVATVADGVVTGVAAGEATITATAGEQSATCTVTVAEKQLITWDAETGTLTITGVEDLNWNNAQAYMKDQGVKPADVKVLVLNKVKEIAGYTFYSTRMPNLTTVEISDVETIGDHVFYGAKALTTVTLTNVINVGTSKTESLQGNSFAECKALTTLALENVGTLGAETFRQCSALTSLTVEGVKSFGRSVFSYCTGLTEVELNGVKMDGTTPFYKCSGIQTVTVKNTDISDGAFTGCTGMTSTTLENIGTIGKRAFSSFSGGEACTSLETVNMTNVTTTGNEAFVGCSSLKNVNMTNVTTIDVNSFASCKALETITIPDSVNTIGKYAFYNCIGLKTVTMGAVDTIEQYAFQNCSGLKIVTMGAVGTIMQNAFWNCSALETIDSLSNVTGSIGGFAFYGCKSLTGLTVNDLTKMGYIGSYNEIMDRIQAILAGTFQLDDATKIDELTRENGWPAGEVGKSINWDQYNNGTQLMEQARWQDTSAGVAEVKVDAYYTGEQQMDYIFVADLSASMAQLGNPEDSNARFYDMQSKLLDMTGKLLGTPGYDCQVAIVTFGGYFKKAGTCNALSFTGSASDAEAYIKSLEPLNENTDYVLGLNKVLEVLNGQQGGRNTVVVFLSDGAPNMYGEKTVKDNVKEYTTALRNIAQQMTDQKVPVYGVLHSPPAASRKNALDWMEVVCGKGNVYESTDTESFGEAMNAAFTAAYGNNTVTVPVNAEQFDVSNPRVSAGTYKYENGVITWTLNGMPFTQHTLTYNLTLKSELASRVGTYTYNINAGAAKFGEKGASVDLDTSTSRLVLTRTVNPTGGGSSGGGGGGRTDPPIEIVDPDVPLAGGPELNKADHFAYISGYEDKTVKPDQNITREEVAMIFYRLLTDLSRAMYDSSSNSFSDVEADRWSNKAISTLANAGILKGYLDGTFQPGEYITRAEFASISARFDSMVEGMENPFSDTAGHWAENAISFAYSKGWVEGYGDSTFRPEQSITRAEVMKWINKVLERSVDADGLIDGIFLPEDNLDTKWYYYEVLEAANGHEFTRKADSTVEKWTALK